MLETGFSPSALSCAARADVRAAGPRVPARLVAHDGPPLRLCRARCRGRVLSGNGPLLCGLSSQKVCDVVSTLSDHVFVLGLWCWNLLLFVKVSGAVLAWKV